MCAYEAAAAAGVAAIGGIASALLGRKSGSGSSGYKFSNTAGSNILQGLKSLSGTTSNSSVWNRLLDTFSGLSKDVGYYANSAFDYYMEDLSFQKQIEYNLKAMQKEFEYSQKSMKEQYGYDTAMQDRSYQYSRSLQNEQNDWSKMMSDTSHQREVADLNAAGLNPILSANGGANAYTSGGAILGGNTPTPNSGVTAKGVDRPHYGSMMDRALTAARIKNETDEANARIAKTNQETKNLQYTKEGLMSQAADLLQGLPGVIDGFTPNGTPYGTDTYAKIVGNGLGSFGKGLLNNLFDKLHIKSTRTDGKSYKWIDDNVINSITGILNQLAGNNVQSPKYIQTNAGYVEDIDDYIRKNYGFDVRKVN